MNGYIFGTVYIPNNIPDEDYWEGYKQFRKEAQARRLIHMKKFGYVGEYSDEEWKNYRLKR